MRKHPPEASSLSKKSKEFEMENLSKFYMSLFVLVLVVVFVAFAPNAQEKGDKHKDDMKPQSVCPVMGGKIDKKVFVDVPGYRIYACCAGCLAQIESDPEKAVAAIKAKGETPERRLVVCPKCGEFKGSAACCDPKAEKCGKCKLHKGSVGCCRDLKPLKGEKDVFLCPKCGEFKGTGECCKPGAKKCGKCGLTKGSPGCCKTDAPAKQKSK
jgi:hypothetical protein